MASITIHQTDIDGVLDAFESLECPAVSIFDGRSQVWSYIGPDIADTSVNLEKYLKGIEGSGDHTAYTLKIYLDCIDRKNITSKTQDNGSFNFRLNEPGVNSRRRDKDGNETPTLTARVMGIEAKIDQLLAEDEGEEVTGQPVGFIGQVMEIVKNPEAMSGIMQIVAGVREMFTAKAIPVLSGLPGEPTDPIAVLSQYDPDIMEDLRRLARLAQKDKAQFDGLIRMLRSMNL